MKRKNKLLIYIILLTILFSIIGLIVYLSTRSTKHTPTPSPRSSPPGPSPPGPSPSLLTNAYASIQSLMGAYNKSGCIGDSAGGSCFKECNIGQQCPIGTLCNVHCGLCDCPNCQACSTSTHIGSWHLANILRLFVNFYKLLIKTKKNIADTSYTEGLIGLNMLAQQTNFFAFPGQEPKTWTNRQDWINNAKFNNLFFDDIGWWILANIDLYELLNTNPSLESQITTPKKQILATAINLTQIISNADSSLCTTSDSYKSIEWNCPNWAVTAAQKNIITNCLVIMAQARLLPFLSQSQYPGLQAEYITSIEKIWNFLTNYKITNPILQYSCTASSPAASCSQQTLQYNGKASLIDITTNGIVIINDHMGTLDSNQQFSACYPCEQRMQTGGNCDNIPCTFINCNQWTYNYGAVIGTLLELDKIKDQLNIQNMGPHTNFLELAKQTTTSLLAAKNVAVVNYNLVGISPTDASFVSKSVLKDNCKLWTGAICNPDQWIFRGLTIWWIGELIKVCADCSSFKSFITNNSKIILQNSTKFNNITIYPFEWDNPQYDWCNMSACIPKCANMSCSAFYKKNGYNRFEISNQIGAAYVLNTEFLLNS